MRTNRHWGARAAAVGGVLTLTMGALAALGATPAGANPQDTPPITQTWGFANPTGGYGELQTQAAVLAPDTIAEGGTVVEAIQGGSQTVPTTQVSGTTTADVNYIGGITMDYPIPANSTFVSATSVGTGTYTAPGATTSSTFTMNVTYCTAVGQTGCTAVATATSTYLGSTPVPYVEVQMPSNVQAAGGTTLTLPEVDITLTAGSTAGSSITFEQTEFDTTANVNVPSLGITNLSAPITAWPAAVVTTFTNPPPLLQQPLAITNIIGPQIAASPTSASIPATGSVAFSITGTNFAPSTSGTLTFTGGVSGAANTDTGTFTVDTTGALTGSISASTAEQTTTTSTPFTINIVATDSTSGQTAQTSVTLTPYQNFVSFCALAAATGSCTLNQLVSVSVVGTNLSASEASNSTTLSPVTLGIGTGDNMQQFDQALGHLATVSVSDDRGTLTGWDVTGQFQSDFANTSAHGPSLDNVIPADFLTWQPAVSLETPGSLPAPDANTPGCPDQTPPPTGYPACTGPSALPAVSGAAAGSPGVNGINGGTNGTATEPAEVTAGPVSVLHNLGDTTGAVLLCGTNSAANGGSAGGGGGTNCDAGLSLAVPPYVASGTYQATLNLVVTGF